MGTEGGGKRGMGREKGGTGTRREEEGFGYFRNLKSTVLTNFNQVNSLNLTAFL